MAQAEHLQSIFLLRRHYKCSWRYEDQFASHSMLCKVSLRTVNDSEKSHEVLFNEEVKIAACEVSCSCLKTATRLSSSWCLVTRTGRKSSRRNETLIHQLVRICMLASP